MRRGDGYLQVTALNKDGREPIFSWGAKSDASSFFLERDNREGHYCLGLINQAAKTVKYVGLHDEIANPHPVYLKDLCGPWEFLQILPTVDGGRSIHIIRVNRGANKIIALQRMGANLNIVEKVTDNFIKASIQEQLPNNRYQFVIREKY